MSRRPHLSRFLWQRRVPMAALAVCAVVAASCGDSGGGDIALVKRTSSSSTTSTVASTTTAPSTTVPSAPTEPTTTTAVAAPGSPPPTVPSAPTDPNAAPPADVVRPPAAWVGFGVPQPGSMFENLRGDHSLDGKGKFVALTFDDGPSQYTKPILDILNFMGVKATFFEIEQQAVARPDVVRQLLADGHHIGSHSRHHPHLAEIPPDAQQDEVLGSIDSLNSTFGAGTVKCFRPPYAQYDQHVLDLVAQRQAAVAMWSFDTLDWKKPAWQSLVTRIVAGAQDRNVLLFHDGGGDRTQTIAALPWVIQGLRDQGFQFIQVC